MLYVRSLGSIRVFPRTCCAAFLLYHFYRYSFPSGFHSLALFLVFLLTSWSMSYCLQKFELPAYNRGDITYDRPRYTLPHGSGRLKVPISCFIFRALHNFLPWPSWAASLPPEFSVFQPVSLRAVGIYQAEVPNLHVNGANPPNPPVNGIHANNVPEARDGNTERVVGNNGEEAANQSPNQTLFSRMSALGGQLARTFQGTTTTTSSGGYSRIDTRNNGVANAREDQA